jgi:hypothetical protein
MLCLTTSRIQDHQRAIASVKPQTEKQSEPVMKFFTPDLYMRFNSSDDEVADRADEEWESAISAYHKHLESLRDQMPPQVKELANLCLHDAELLAWEQPIEPFFELLPFRTGFAILSIRQGDEIVSLIYVLWDQLRKHESREDWPFSKRRAHCLYDEVDVTSNHRGTFFHRVLLSDGTIIEIPFLSVLIHSFRLEDVPESDASRQIA